MSFLYFKTYEPAHEMLVLVPCKLNPLLMDSAELHNETTRFWSLESPYHLASVSGAHFTQVTILIVILVSSGSAKSRTQQFAVGGFLVTQRGWPG